MNVRRHRNYDRRHWLQRAAELLEESADELKRSHTIGDEWDPSESEVLDSYREYVEAALVVREVLRSESTPDPLGEALNSGDGSYRP